MFCAECGCQLRDEARFCTSCGASVWIALEDEPSAAASAPDAVPSASAAKSANFKTAMDSTKARGKRRMPVVVLVALALALTSAIALAAHYVYTNYVAPSFGERGDGFVASNADLTIQANEAYEGIITEYKEAIRAIESGQIEGLEKRYTYPNYDFLLNYPVEGYKPTLCWAAQDFDQNGAPELIVYENTDGGIVQLFTYSEEGVVELLSRPYKHVAHLAEDGLIYLEFVGAYTEGYAYAYDLAEGELVEVSSLAWTEDEAAVSGGSEKYVRYVLMNQSGETIEFIELADEFVYGDYLGQYTAMVDFDGRLVIE